jgi:hypothetical protein
MKAKILAEIFDPENEKAAGKLPHSYSAVILANEACPVKKYVAGK